jgi:hypothetical protein
LGSCDERLSYGSGERNINLKTRCNKESGEPKNKLTFQGATEDCTARFDLYDQTLMNSYVYSFAAVALVFRGRTSYEGLCTLGVRLQTWLLTVSPLMTMAEPLCTLGASDLTMYKTIKTRCFRVRNK